MQKIRLKSISKLVTLLSLFIVCVYSFINCTFSSHSNVGLAGVASSGANGQTLFNANCASCHNGPGGSDPTKVTIINASVVQMITAFSTAPMNTFPAIAALSAVDIDAIASYLNGANACQSNFAPQRSPLRLLSNNEYDNIAKDVFGLTASPSADNTFAKPEAGISGFLNTGITSDKSAPVITDLMIQKYWAAAGEIATYVITNKAVTGSAYSKLAACAVGVATISNTCAASIVQNAVLQIWRRPVSTAAANNEQIRLQAILQASSPFDSGFHDLLTALLMSPNFLTVNLSHDQSIAGGSSFSLDNYQLASRLAFFLWQSTPDSQLLTAAAAGSLTSVTNLQAQVKRMLKDPKGLRLASVLTNEWLGVGSITGLGISSTAVSAATLNDFVTETTMMFQDIITNDGSFLNALSANYSFLNQNLATYYGVAFSGPVSTNFYKTSVASTPRLGVLNQAGFLIATAGAPTASHPVLRGKAVANQIGCFAITPPPANLDTTPPVVPETDTPRQMLDLHAARAQCASCHNTLDPLGLPLENFDPFGNWRTNYTATAQGVLGISGNPPIDPSGTLPTGESFTTEQAYMKTLIASPQVRSCLAMKVMAIGVTRGVASADDVCTAGQISVSTITDKSTFSDFITSIVLSPQFQLQTTESQ